MTSIAIFSFGFGSHRHGTYTAESSSSLIEKEIYEELSMCTKYDIIVLYISSSLMLLFVRRIQVARLVISSSWPASHTHKSSSNILPFST